MTTRLPMLPTARLLGAAATLMALASCASAPGTRALVAGQAASFEGRIISVDTNPWAYDGNAVVAVGTPGGTVNVQLPARWNLCKAQPLGDVQALKAGDRVQVVGTATAENEVVVCGKADDRLRKVD
jgi:hypothetical protein